MVRGRKEIWGVEYACIFKKTFGSEGLFNIIAHLRKIVG